MRSKMEVLSMDKMDELDILGHYCNTLWVDHTKVGILQEASQKVLCSFLQSQDHVYLEVQVIFTNFLVNFADQTCKGALVYEELSALLEPADFTEGFYPGPVLPGPLQHASLPESPFLGPCLPLLARVSFRLAPPLLMLMISPLQPSVPAV